MSCSISRDLSKIDPVSYERNEQCLLQDRTRSREAKSPQLTALHKRKDSELDVERKTECYSNRNFSFSSELFLRTESALRCEPSYSEKENNINVLGFFDFYRRRDSMDFDRDMSCVAAALQMKCDCGKWSKEHILKQFFGWKNCYNFINSFWKEERTTHLNTYFFFIRVILFSRTSRFLKFWHFEPYIIPK